MTVPAALGRLPALAAAPVLAAALALGGCLDLGLVREVAFPPGIPGLATGEPWIVLPVGVWTTEGEIEPVALAACTDPACSVPAAVGLFRARGAARDAALRDAAAPERLARAILMTRNPRAPRAVAVAERLREGRFSGVLVTLARRDGARAAAGVALVSPDGGTVALVVAPTADGARRVARDVAAGLG